MNEQQFKDMIKNGSKSVRNLNSDKIDYSRSSKKSELLDKKQMEKSSGKKEMATTHRLSNVEISYFCQHGQSLDPDDNAIYAAVKPIADAIVKLGFARNDKEFKTTASQRMDGNNSYI